MITGAQIAALRPEILEAAAALLERDGWCQNSLHDGERRCARGAIIAATEDVLGVDAVRGVVIGPSLTTIVGGWAIVDHALRDHLKAEGVFDGCLAPSVPAWNDTRGRTKDDVISAVRKAALTLRAKVQD